MGEKIADGGIGTIVRATHTGLDQVVAIKHLQAAVLGRPAIVERFRSEARLAAAIRSDHVVRVHDVGEVEGAGPYIVMEYLEGEDLGAVLARGPLTPSFAVDCVLQACEAIAEAHALGIVHRDLKPENLFVARRAKGSIVKVVDFGISKAPAREDSTIRRTQKTATNERFGTPSYMSPEQLRSTASVDARTDIWALGVVLFELLTAQLPFDQDSVPALAVQIVSGAPRRLRECAPTANPALEAIISRCLEKDPAQRYANVAELARDLAPFGTSESAHRAGRIASTVSTSIAPARDARDMVVTDPELGPIPTPSAFEVVSLPETQAPRPSKKIIGATIAGALATLALVALPIGLTLHRAPAKSAVNGVSGVIAASQQESPAPSASTTPVPEAVVAFEVDAVAAPDAGHGIPAKANAHARAPMPSSSPAEQTRPTPVAPKAAQDDYAEFGGRR